MKPYKFSDGTAAPVGARLVSLVEPIHMDDRIYPEPRKFDGFRFSRPREEKESAKHHAASTSNEFLTFSHGEHAWYSATTFLLLIKPRSILCYQYAQGDVHISSVAL
jgi:hypothetical protein